MAAPDEWQPVAKPKRDTRHYMKQGRALQLQKELNVAGFAAAMISPEARRLQDTGLVYARVLRGDEEPALGPGEVSLPVGNKYGDAIVFVRK